MSGELRIVRGARALKETCERMSKQGFVCVDTEFVRDRTYWPVLCLVQLGAPSGERQDAALIDPLAGGLDLGPLWDLMDDDRILKVFHSGSQDFEICSVFGRGVPRPVFDTQVAAAFCGYGHQVAYHALVQQVVRRNMDKGQQVTNWKRRPLTDRQLRYALDDVLYLPKIYLTLRDELERSGRLAWVEEEMSSALDPERYGNDPRRAWRRLRSKSQDPRYLSILREVAAWRELEAQRRDIPRQHVLGDAAVTDIARLAPAKGRDLRSLRSVQRQSRRAERDEGAILEAVRRGADCAAEAMPAPSAPVRLTDSQAALASLLRVMLKALAAEQGIAEPVVATAEDVERLAMDPDADHPLLRGWRRNVFGEALLRLCRGEVAMTVSSGRVVSTPLPAVS